MKENEVNFEKYQKHYSEEGFWEKVKNVAKTAGIKIIYEALKLFITQFGDKVPAWARAVIWGALGYFILPLDLIPDVMPGVGFVDDGGVLAAAMGLISKYITDEVKLRAKAKLSDWFGADAIAKIED